MSKNPILNNPYQEPQFHYFTREDGTLDYKYPQNGRRLFAPLFLNPNRKTVTQRSAFSYNESAPHEHIINRLRKYIQEWRSADYPHVSEISKTLLKYWFGEDSDKNNTFRLFFAQQEVIESLIWLNEVAFMGKTEGNLGNELQTLLAEANLVPIDGKATLNPEEALPRLAFKMATGTGKTTVMAAFIVYHYFNRKYYKGESIGKRYADKFLIITPNITIKDRLAELQSSHPKNIYLERGLIPKDWRKDFSIDGRLVITNYHSFEPKNLDGNKVGAFDNKLKDGKKVEAKSSFLDIKRKVMPNFSSKDRLLVINDEAHHCYLPRPNSKKNDTDNQVASVWYNAILEIKRHFQLLNVYDLSATPYFLGGSGYPEGKLFDWIVTDFGLIEAIESGLVKIPYLPYKDNNQEQEGSKFKNIYENVKKQLPKSKDTDKIHPNIPSLVADAIEAFYQDYEKSYKSFGDIFSTHPVMIFVCANTAISREIYRYIAGYETQHEEKTIFHKGKYPLFSNIDDYGYKKELRTLLIDSEAINNSNGVINDSFKHTFKKEIQTFKQQSGKHDASESEILREVMNTVGKQGQLGKHIHCVVSVSMLTEGWDCNTVTHIVGLRAFGSQLLCEQVIGRALRRRNYILERYDRQGEVTTDKRKVHQSKFPPEYANIIGVPFDFMSTKGDSERANPRPHTQITPVAERKEEFELFFPNVEKYVIRSYQKPLKADLSKLPPFVLNGKKIVRTTQMSSSFSEKNNEIDNEHLRQSRHQTVIKSLNAHIAKKYIQDKERPDYSIKQSIILENTIREFYFSVQLEEGAFRQLLDNRKDEVLAHIERVLELSNEYDELIHAQMNYYNPFGSTSQIKGIVNRDKAVLYKAQKSHLNYAVTDSDYEQKLLNVLENMPEVKSYFKNLFQSFVIPYKDSQQKWRKYVPDFVALIEQAGKKFHLIIETSAEKTDYLDNKAEKKRYTENYWIPSIALLKDDKEFRKSYEKLEDRHFEWRFLEITDTNNMEKQLQDKIKDSCKEVVER